MICHLKKIKIKNNYQNIQKQKIFNVVLYLRNINLPNSHLRNINLLRFSGIENSFFDFIHPHERICIILNQRRLRMLWTVFTNCILSIKVLADRITIFETFTSCRRRSVVNRFASALILIRASIGDARKFMVYSMQ